MVRSITIDQLLNGQRDFLIMGDEVSTLDSSYCCMCPARATVTLVSNTCYRAALHPVDRVVEEIGLKLSISVAHVCYIIGATGQAHGMLDLIVSPVGEFVVPHSTSFKFLTQIDQNRLSLLEQFFT